MRTAIQFARLFQKPLQRSLGSFFYCVLVDLEEKRTLLKMSSGVALRCASLRFGSGDRGCVGL